MADLHNITPYQAPGRLGWNASFYDRTGRRVTRGLGTRDEAEAQLLCRALALLHHHKPASPEDAPSSMPPRALELYFGAGVVGPFELRKSINADRVARVLESDVPAELRLVGAEIARDQLERELAEEREARARLQGQLDVLRASALGRAVGAEGLCPDLAQAIDEFSLHMRSAATANHAKYLVSVARRFVKSLPSDVRKPVQITSTHVDGWLASEAEDADLPIVRRARHRARLGKFINWAAKTWGYVSPMKAVQAPTLQQLERLRDDIHWHELEEVEAALQAIEAGYWRTLVAVLAFAGLRLSELAWLRREDVTAIDGGARHQLWIATVDDGHGAKHELKTGHSRRAVEVHPVRLWPLLQGHLESGAGEVFLFPVPKDVRRKPRQAGHPERWLPTALGRRLGGESWKERSGVLPAGMSVMSLRRTFGSLLLRSGCSAEQVAAAMGNTPGVVRKHYARILGAEVEVRF